MPPSRRHDDPPNVDLIEVERRYLNQLVLAHDKVHETDREHNRLIDEGHWRQHANEHQAVGNWEKAHSDKHEADSKAVGVAIDAEQRRLAAHREAHEAAHGSHEALHDAYEKAHEAMHGADLRALDAALASMDKRLESMNQFRDQLREQTATFVRTDAFDAFKQERRLAIEEVDRSMDRRWEELRALIATEREERREQFGVRKGAQDNRVAIYAGVGVAGSLLAILIVLLNILGPSVPPVVP